MPVLPFSLDKNVPCRHLLSYLDSGVVNAVAFPDGSLMLAINELPCHC